MTTENRRRGVAPATGDGFILLIVAASGAMTTLLDVFRRLLRQNDAVDIAHDGRILVHLSDEASEADVPHIVSRLERACGDAGCGPLITVQRNERIVIASPPRSPLEEVAHQLESAIENGELVLYYQPQICLTSGNIVGAEALLRWNTPHSGLVMPGDFIPLIEHTWAMQLIDKWALQTAIRQIRQWMDAGAYPVRLSVNVSATQFAQEGLVDHVRYLLADTGVPASFIEIEITETAIVGDMPRAIEVMRHLRAMGVRLSMDDFGTGHSCLSNLAHFPVHTLKLDRSFVSRLHEPGDKTRNISAAILAMARQLELLTVGEGVECQEQRQELAQLGCDAYQGYLFSPAVSAAEFSAFFQPSSATVGLQSG